MIDRVEAIRRLLQARFNAQDLQVIDEGHLHAGHAGAATGRGHFRVRLAAAEFASMSLLQRHRAVYEALGSLMDTDIHALAIEARMPS